VRAKQQQARARAATRQTALLLTKGLHLSGSALSFVTAPPRRFLAVGLIVTFSVRRGFPDQARCSLRGRDASSNWQNAFSARISSGVRHGRPAASG
jgi:hypothetical protein